MLFTVKGSIALVYPKRYGFITDFVQGTARLRLVEVSENLSAWSRSSSSYRPPPIDRRRTELKAYFARPPAGLSRPDPHPSPPTRRPHPPPLSANALRVRPDGPGLGDSRRAHLPASSLRTFTVTFGFFVPVLRRFIAQVGAKRGFGLLIETRAGMEL